jgi:hypothetical protein
MLRFWMILTAISACCLIAASCADPGTAVTSVETAKEASLAAEAATQAVTRAATQVSAALQSGQSVVHSDGKGTTIIETKDYWIIYRGSQRIVIFKTAAQRYGEPDDNNQ